MERTEGKAQFGRNSNPEEIMLVVGKNRDYLATVRIRQAGGGAVAEAMKEKRIANAKDLLSRWNLCEPDGLVPKLVEACRIGLSYVNAEMQGAPRLIQDLQVDKWEIEQALTAYKALKEKPDEPKR